MKPEQIYINLYKQNRELLCQYAPEIMNRVRDKSLADFEQMGFPTTTNEDYRHSDVSEQFLIEYGMNLKRLNFPVNPYEVFRCDVPNMSTLLYFMINDAFYKQQLPDAVFEGVFIGNMEEFSARYPEIANRYYAKQTSADNNGITAFNTLFAQDAFVLYLAEGVKLSKAIQLVNILRSNVDLLANRRLLIILAKNAEAKLLLCDHGMDKVKFLVTQVAEIYLEENAAFELYELEENTPVTTRLSNVYVKQHSCSRFSHNVITLNCGFTRNNLWVSLDGKQAETLAGGIAIADEKQHIDNFTWIDHKEPACHSNELYKYILDGQALGSFNGRIVVRENAQKTEAYQTNRNLCFTKEARMYSNPQLEIYADDVKCSHGLTTGQIDENALFYLRSRGIPKEEAMLLLKFAFTADVLDRVHLEPLRDRLRLLIEKRLRDELPKCERCAVCIDN